MKEGNPPRFIYFVAGSAALFIGAGIAFLVNWLLTISAFRILLAIVIGAIIALPIGGTIVDLYLYNKCKDIQNLK